MRRNEGERGHNSMVICRTASVPSTAASAGTCGAVTLASFNRKASPSEVGWFDLTGSPFHSGCEARPAFRSVPIANALLLVDALRKANAPFQFQRDPTMGHMGINDEVIKQARAFIKEQSEQK